MPTDAQVKADKWYQRETIPPAILELARALAAHYKLPETNFGIRGNLRHLRGYHRSREFVQNSPLCTDDRYSVSRTDGDANRGFDTDCCALDISAPHAQLIAMCKWLDKAVRAGSIEKITEWYGSFGDDDRVDGYDNIANRIASSDSSHLTHLHISFDRGMARKAHTDVFQILTGGLTMAGFTDQVRDQYIASISERVAGLISGENPILYKVPGSDRQYDEPNALQSQLDRIEGLLIGLGDPADMARNIAAGIVANSEVLAAILDAVREEIRRNLEPELMAEATWSHLKSKL